MQSPVVLIVFNRPQLTARVLERIREARPAKLFVVADGPRSDRPDDAEKCRQVRELIDQGVDWPCEVVRDYSDVNLGCGRRVSTGISRVFDQVEEAIILEDDCLPEPSFFKFCDELLARYRHDDRVGMISGTNQQQGQRLPDGNSYFFSRYAHVWGWATWRRAWRHYDFSISCWPKWRDAGGLKRCFSNSKVRRFWRKVLDGVYAGSAKTWDYQWSYCCFSRGMLSILPATDMVDNLGFGPDATHTVGSQATCHVGREMVFPLVHPARMVPDKNAENRTAARDYSRAPGWLRCLRRMKPVERGRALLERLARFWRVFTARDRAAETT